MAEPHWTSYVGMITGIIGAVTGIAGAIMGYVSYRKSNSLKSLDLRLELRKAVNDLCATLLQLEMLIENANRSREAIGTAKGLLKSGVMEKWKKDVEDDEKTVKKLLYDSPSVDDNYNDLDPKELESKLVVIHRLQVQTDELKSKYDLAIIADDEDRKKLREDARIRFTTK